MEKKIACIYPRKSREDATTLDGQLQSCIQWCEANGVEYEVFKEEGSASSEDWNRPMLNKMMKAIENLEFNLCVVSEQSRICRDDQFPVFKNLLRETETLFVTADNNSIFDFANPDDELKSDILQAVGKNELSRTKIRLKRGTVQSAKKGNWQGKKAPIGYEYNSTTKRLKKSNDADVIRMMFELYIDGKSTVEISHKFINENVLAYHKKKGEMVPITWSKSTIARCLKNITYAGHTVFGKTKLKKLKGKKEKIAVDEDKHILVENTHEAIVSPEEFEKVQKIMNKKRMQPPAMKHVKHTFSGLIACANCGKKHTFERQMDAKREWRISSCTTRNYNDDFTEYKICGNSGCKLGIVEHLFFASLKAHEQQIEEHIELIKSKETTNEDHEKQFEAKKKAKTMQVEKLKMTRKRILQFIESGDMYDEEEEVEKMQEIKIMQNQIKALQSEIDNLTTKETESEAVQLERILNNIRLFLQGAKTDVDERKLNEMLHQFLEVIVYKKNGRWADVTIEIHLKEDVEEIMLNSGMKI